jgi:hypothetical protein
MRNKKVQAILEAWWNLDRMERTASASQALATLNQLLDEARQGTPLGREDLLDGLWSHYKEYRRTRFMNQKLEDRHTRTE